MKSLSKHSVQEAIDKVLSEFGSKRTGAEVGHIEKKQKVVGAAKSNRFGSFGSYYKVRQVKNENEWKSILNGSSAATLKNPIPMYFGIQIQHSQKLAETEEQQLAPRATDMIDGFATFYIAYSTWDGRFLFVDHLTMTSSSSWGRALSSVSSDSCGGIPDACDLPIVNDDEIMEIRVLHILSKIAVELGCSRLTWRVSDLPTKRGSC